MQGCSSNKTIKAIAFAVVAVAAHGLPATAAAQQAAANCTYETCALGLAPVWNGLAVTRGISERQIANLGFFWPSDIRPVFADNAAALEAAEEALQTRTIAAVLTDAGLLMLGTGLARAAFQRDFDRFSKAMAYTGATAIGVSVPLHFAADGMLSRAVWWHNRRYSR